MLFNKDSKILFTGDSITDAGRARPLGKGTTGLGSGYVSLINALLTLDFPQESYQVLNTGISADTTRNLISRWQSDVLDINPDYLSIMIGINDVWRAFRPEKITEHVPLDEFSKNYKELTSAAAKKSKKIILMSPFLAEANESDLMKTMLREYISFIKNHAAENDFIFVNLQEAVDKYLCAGVEQTKIAIDRIHPTPAGCMIIARAFMDTVTAADCV